MKIDRIDITNFRLLKDISLSLEGETTVIVGRNNSGKTSLTELFRRLLSDRHHFALEDFSLAAHSSFWNAFVLHRQKLDEEKVRAELPAIEIRLTIGYDMGESLGPLVPFIVDLDPDCTSTVVLMRYELAGGEIDALFDGLDHVRDLPKAEQLRGLCKGLRQRVPKLFELNVWACDPNDLTNTKALDWKRVRELIHGAFINAQRGLDDETLRNRNVLGAILEALFQTASANSADPQDKAVVHQLEEAVKSIQVSIDTGFNKQLLDLLPAFSLFGYPGLSDPSLMTETTLDVKRLLTDHTKVHYAGVNGINLPEAYNGLGARNLIFILLKLLEFFKVFVAQERPPGVHLVFIEEPEVHLHPQMQEVFISKLSEIVGEFSKKLSSVPWPVQFVVTTHSSHVANRANFDSIRYFLAASEGNSNEYRVTKVKDLREGIGGTPKANRDFLHKYMTLTRCDLLFADAAILIEGAAERLLMPRMIELGDRSRPIGARLATRYLTIMEVGGAYAHIFFDLLSFLELRTLVVTDIDSINHGDGSRACAVSTSTGTSNACIKTWYNDQSISAAVLLSKTSSEKIIGNRRLAYQVSEHYGGACGRSFEDAFMLANPALFPFEGPTEVDRELQALSCANALDKKTDFALKYAAECTVWVVPRYIAEGLQWLAQSSEPAEANPSSEVKLPQ